MYYTILYHTGISSKNARWFNYVVSQAHLKHRQKASEIGSSSV